MRIKAMPVIGLGHRIPGPVGGFEVFEDDARFLVLFLGIAPDVEIAFLAARRGAPRALKPRMLIGGVIEHQLGDHAQAAPVRFAQENFEIFERAVVRMNLGVARDVVTVVPQRRRIERQKPERRDAEIVQIVELFREPFEIADAVGVAVGERADMQLINDRVLVPERIVARSEFPRGCFFRFMVVT